MPRIRTIKPKFWDDIKLSKISRDARLLFIGIWNFSDDLGVIVAEPVWIKSKVFPYDHLEPQQFEKWLDELTSKKFIIPITYNNELFFYIRTFDRHQRINKPNHDEIYIDKEELMKIIDKSRNNPGTIPESSGNNHGAIPEQSREERNRNSKGEERNGREGESGFDTGKFLVPEMQKIWKSFKPNYPADKIKDLPALQSIAVFICEQAGINYHARGSTDDKNLYDLWGTISRFVSEHSFYKRYSLHQVEKYIQSITQEIQNGQSNSKTGKQGTGKVNSQQLHQAVDDFYKKSG